MVRKDKIKADCDKLTAEFQKFYGENCLIIGRAQGHTYMSIPDDPKRLGDLIERLMAAMVIENKADHFAAMARAAHNVAKRINGDIDNEQLN